MMAQILFTHQTFFLFYKGNYQREQAHILKQLNKSVLMWDFGLEKQAIESAAESVDYLMKRIGNRPEIVLLLHDGDPSGRHSRNLTVEALPMLITALQGKATSL